MSRRKQTTSPRTRARRRALQALYQWQLNDDSPTAIIAQFEQEQQATGVDTELFQALFKGVANGVETLDTLICKYTDRPLQQLDATELSILRLATWELQHTLATPYRVVLDEAIDLARTFGAEGSYQFVNGVLDQLVRELRQTELG